jgi:N-acylneuraminate cytidylyltransferase
MDFDGVFTANTVYLNEEGVESVRCDRGDGMGVSLLREAGLPMFVLSTETNKVVAARASKLKLPVLHGRSDKLTDLREWLSTNGHLMERTIYIGNDVNDVGCLREAGFAVAPADAHPTAKAVADHVLSRNGGCGAIRELADLLLPLLESNP